MKKKPLFSRKMDSLDALAAVFMVLAGGFAITFFWQVSAGAAGSEESFLERIRVKSEKRILEERERIGFLLDTDAAGGEEQRWAQAMSAAPRFEGNSQYHLFMAVGYRLRGDRSLAIREYRKALEANRDYTDRRSDFYIGETLRPFLRECRALNLSRERPGRETDLKPETIRDLFYIERSLAGGCH